MSQHYSDPKRASEPHALPDLETFYAEQPTHPVAEAGWYYWYCFPGCLPDSEPIGPFATEADALTDARSHEAEYDDEALMDADGRTQGEIDAEARIDNLILELGQTFGAEWAHLSEPDRQLIVRDCTEEGGVSDLAEYRRNIGAGNLASYARVMAVRFRR